MAKDGKGGQVGRAPFLGRTNPLSMGGVAHPFLVDVHDYIVAGVTWDPVELRAALPSALDPLPDQSGIIAIYKAPSGNPPAPFAKAYVSAAVLGVENPDGTPAMFVLAEIATESYALGLAETSRVLRPGRVCVCAEGNVVRGEAVSETGDVLTMELRRQSAEPPRSSGVHNYLQVDRRGMLRISPISYTAMLGPTNMLSLTVPRMEASGIPVPRVTGVLWAAHSARLRLTFGADEPFRPKAMVDDREKAATAFLALLSRIGHLAALCLPDGRALAVPPRLRDTLAALDRRGVLRPSLSGLGGPGQMAVVDGPDGNPMVARALPVPAAVLGFDCVLVLLADPARPLPDAEAVLLLFGLTPAEARLAAAIGGGTPLDAVAEALGITQNTARSTLRQVFAKLGVGRQAELVGLVARLGP